ncbi:MAG: hypothetical protein F6K10_06610 [Moorea sp. SIO2B7]|nr:hypothetical protein [Moorena sp. SIO2B7]
MLADNLYWVLRYREVNISYFFYGLDRKNSPSLNSFLSTRQQMSLIGKQIASSGGTTTKAIVKDKFLFALVAQALGYPSPYNIAFLEPDVVDCFSPRQLMSYETFIEKYEGFRGFCKPIYGKGARGIFTLGIQDGKIFVNDDVVSLKTFQSYLKEKTLLQEKIIQHEDMSKLYPSSINTIRLVTILKDRKAIPLAAALRVGAYGNFVDNIKAGGMVAGINLETGKLQGNALFKYRKPGKPGIVTHHPNTGVALDGYQIPMFQECVDLACQFHRDLGNLPTIGWDIAITPTTPCIIEGNTLWDASMFLALEPNFKTKLIEVIKRPHT